MSPQEMIDSNTAVYSLGEEQSMFNNHSDSDLEEGKKILKQLKEEYKDEIKKEMTYDYKSQFDLYHMNLSELKEEYIKVRAYTAKIEEIARFVAQRSKAHESSNSNDSEVNQIRRRNKRARG